MIVKITLISFRAIFFSNLIYHVALINLTLRMIISKCILTSVMNLNLLNIKSLKKKFNMQKKSFMKMQNLKLTKTIFFNLNFFKRLTPPPLKKNTKKTKKIERFFGELIVIINLYGNIHFC